MKSGIAVVGSIIVDKINEISAYPSEGELTKINSIKKSVGGCVPNVAIDLKRICPELTVKAVGKIGDDEDGKYIKRVLIENGVNIQGIKSSPVGTSFTEVMSVTGGQRTFFAYLGANTSFGLNDIDFDFLSVKMLHLGYFLLLDMIDNGDGEKILKVASDKGIKTSIDLVSENSDRYSLVLPCLPFVDNLIINEVEAGNLAGVVPTSTNLLHIARKLKEYGVRERVIIHTPDLSVCVSKDGEQIVSSFTLSDGFIKGTTGAGDAFCAGALCAIYQEKSDKEILEFASSSAVASLSQVDAISGMCTEREIKELCKDLERKDICL